MIICHLFRPINCSDEPLMKRSEQSISRILCRKKVTLIFGNDHSSVNAGCPTFLATYPGAGRATLSAPLFGLAPGGVYKASPVTQGTGALLPHLFTLTFLNCLKRRYTFCCTFLHVAVTPRYGAPCPVVFGLSSG